MKRLLGACLLVLLLATPALAAFSPQDWRWRAPVETNGATGLLHLQLPPGSPLWGHAQPNLSDLRLVDDAGDEVPYRRWDEPTRKPLAVTLINVGRLTDGEAATTATLDFGSQQEAITALFLEVAGPAHFMRPVLLHGSQDQQEWTELETADFIYQLPDQGGLRSTTVRLSHPAQFRYMRVRIPDGGLEPLAITGARAAAALHAEPALEEVYAGPPTLSTAHDGNLSTHLIDLGAPRLSQQVTIEVGAQNYHRPITVDGSNDQKTWRPLGDGVIYRYDQPGKDGAAQPVAYNGCVCRYIRVTIQNGHDQPLPVTAVRLAGTPVTLLFRAQSGKRYWLYAGNQKAMSPQYDIAQQPITPDGLPIVRPGAAEPNPAYTGPVDGRPWSERNPWLLWVALGAAVSAAGAGLFVMLRSMLSGKNGGD